jgi:ABC-type transport system substrate-binding protein
MIDALRHLVIRSPDAALLAMQGGVADFSPDQIRTGDIEKQFADGMLVTSDLGFHMGFIAYNIRPTSIINDYWRNETGHRAPVSYWPLHDMEFRHALIHSYDQLGIIPPIYGYIVTPVRSLVPPAQSKYYNPGVPEHSFLQGDPFASTVYVPATHSNADSCSILRYAGYTFVDADSSGDVTDADYWKCPDDSDMPYMEIWTPLIGVAPTSFQHGAEFVNDLRAIGLAATEANGNKGFLNLGRDFNEYLEDVYDRAWFDAYMVFYSLGRIPSQLYSLLHTSQDCLTHPGRRNAVGVHDPADGGAADTVDELTDIVKFSLDTDDIETAAKACQELLYDTSPGVAKDNVTLSYMLLYSRSYFNVFGTDVTGAVKSPGYGSDNGWTFFNIMTTRTEDVYGDATLESLVIYINGDAPDSFNPTYATTVYEWNIIGQTQDGLTAVNPYNHYDIPWLASDWTITPTVAGMDIDFTLRENSTWQDGHNFTAGDVEFCLEFLRDRSVPRYAETWEQLIDVVVTDDLHLTVEADEAGIDLFYDFSGLGPMLPPQIWDRAWASDAAVLDYDPTEAYNVASGYTDGPHPPPTNLFGTGPFIFIQWDATNEYDDMIANRNYFMTQQEIADIKASMFWQVGDQSWDGVVNVIDLTFVSFAFGCIEGLDPCYDPDADFNDDGIVDIRDIYIGSYHLLWQKEWP